MPPLCTKDELAPGVRTVSGLQIGQAWCAQLQWGLATLVVQKYGMSSVADAYGIKRVA